MSDGLDNFSEDQLRKLSTKDLEYLAAGKLENLSTEGLTALSVPEISKQQSVFEQAQPPSIPSAMFSGVKKGISDIGAGLQQLGYGMQKIPTEVGTKAYQSAQEKLDALQREQAQKQMAYEEIRKQRPIAAPTGEFLPELLIRSPAAVGLLEATKYAPTYGERGVKGVTGGLSAGLGNIIGSKVGAYVNPQISSDTLAAIKGVESFGVKPRLSEITGSPELAALEDVVANAPFGKAMLKPQQKNQLAYNQAASKTIGENSQILSEDVLSNARSRLGYIYNTIEQLPVDVAPIRFDKNIESVADRILKKQGAAKTMGVSAAETPEIKAIAQAWKDKSKTGDFFSGQDYKFTREHLSDLAWNAEGSIKNDYRDLLNALDTAAENSLKKVGQEDLANQLRLTNQQYANLKTLEKGNVIQNGDVDIKKLRNAIKLGRESAYKEGKVTGDLNKLAKYSEATAPIREGSQTAQRSFYKMLQENPYSQVPMAAVNALFANTLASPLASYVPRKLAGTPVAPVLGTIAERGARLPIQEANQDLLLRRLFQTPKGL